MIDQERREALYSRLMVAWVRDTYAYERLGLPGLIHKLETANEPDSRVLLAMIFERVETLQAPD